MEPFAVIMGLNFVKSVIDGFQQNKRNLIQQTFQQAENEASRVAQRENILLQLQAQRERDALSFENRLREHDYLATIQNVWPLKIPPREYINLFRPSEDDRRVPFNLIIDNRIQTRMGCLCDSLWSELEHSLRACFGGVRPYQFNSDIFTKGASGAGVEISLLRKYSEHIPTLVLVPEYSDSALRLTAYAWGGGMGHQTGSISIPLTELRIETARKLTNTYIERYEKAKKVGVKGIEFDTTIARYDEMFKQEKASLDKGLSREDCHGLGIYKELYKVPAPNEASDIEKEVYKNIARSLSQKILLPVGQVIDAYFIEGFGLAPRLPYILAESNVARTVSEKIISDYASTLVADMKSGRSLVSSEQFDNFKRSISEAGFNELSKSPEIALLTYSTGEGTVSNISPVPHLGCSRTRPIDAPTQKKFV